MGRLTCGKESIRRVYSRGEISGESGQKESPHMFACAAKMVWKEGRGGAWTRKALLEKGLRGGKGKVYWREGWKE